MNEQEITSPINDRIQAMDKYNSLIEQTKGKLFFGLGYEQEGTLFFNKAYFRKGQEITDQYIQSQIEESNKKIEELKNIDKQLESEQILNDIQKKLISDSIKRSILLTRYHQHAIYIEAEKAGYALSNKERIHHRNEVMKIEDELYGPSITKLEGRKENTINKLHEIYLKNSNLLSEEEKKTWQQLVLDQFPIATPISHQENQEKEATLYIDEKHMFDLVTLLLEIEGFEKENLVKIQISSDHKSPEERDGIYYIPAEWKDKEMYDYFDNLGIGQHFKIIKKTLGSSGVNITKKNDAFKKNQISITPPKNGKYDIKKQILPIIYDHEISTHVNTGIGNFNNIYIKDPERSDLEEGIALFNQTMTENKDIKEIYEPGISDIGMFLGEHFDDQTLTKLITIYLKLIQDNSKNVDDRVRRIKMGVPLGEKGSRRKDLTYGNGKEIVRELEELTKTPEGIEQLNRYAKAIYSTKLGYEAIKNIDDVLDGIKKMDDLEPNFPIFAGKIIYRKLFKGTLDKEKMLENDLRRFINTDKKVTEKQKRLLVKILQLIRAHGE